MIQSRATALQLKNGRKAKFVKKKKKKMTVTLVVLKMRLLRQF